MPLFFDLRSDLQRVPIPPTAGARGVNTHINHIACQNAIKLSLNFYFVNTLIQPFRDFFLLYKQRIYISIYVF